MTAIARPDRRSDIINALSILATLQPHGVRSWPGLTEAVHWLVDDTFWDDRHPRDDIGTVLADTSGAEAVSATLEPLLAILDELGPTAPDEHYLTHPRWPELAQAATGTHQLMAGRAPARP
ncbi:SCO4402 family protein [Micromonospora sp. KLBMP9576]|uniref:SCO4402 family protein n=1 Tax=Micromonospora sp. KLBMP9576 TaxID=3424769 RepID=UPI003D8EA77D